MSSVALHFASVCGAPGQPGRRTLRRAHPASYNGHAVAFRTGQARCSRREGVARPSIATILAQCPDHSLRVTIDDGQQTLGCPIIKTKAIGKLLPTQPQPLAERDNQTGGGIVDDPTRQTRLAANMGEYLAQSRFDLTGYGEGGYGSLGGR